MKPRRDIKYYLQKVAYERLVAQVIGLLLWAYKLFILGLYWFNRYLESYHEN